jgi:hypothetical protein
MHAVPASAGTRCGAWTPETTPNPGVSDLLYGVAATGHDHAWAVGNWSNPGDSTGGTLIEHDDGAGWRVARSPSADASLDAVAVVPHSREAWAVGASNAGTFTEHWDGSAWSIVPSPNPEGFPPLLRGLWAASANDVWAVGWWEDFSDAVHPLTEHWDGSAWSIVPTPQVGIYTELDAVSGTSGDDVWAVGAAVATAGEPGQPVTEHWDGSAWTVVPGRFPASSRFWAVDVLPSGAGWAVGTRDSDEHTFVAILIDGTWRGVRSPNVGRGDNVLAGVTLSSPSDAWAVGTSNTNNDRRAPLFLHWNGRAWSAAQSPPLGSGTGELRAVAANSRSGKVWAVGDQGHAEFQTLAETHCPA